MAFSCGGLCDCMRKSLLAGVAFCDRSDSALDKVRVTGKVELPPTLSRAPTYCLAIRPKEISCHPAASSSPGISHWSSPWMATLT